MQTINGYQVSIQFVVFGACWGLYKIVPVSELI